MTGCYVLNLHLYIEAQGAGRIRSIPHDVDESKRIAARGNGRGGVTGTDRHGRSLPFCSKRMFTVTTRAMDSFAHIVYVPTEKGR